MIRRFLSIVIMLTIFSSESLYAWAPFLGKTHKGEKVYLGPVPIQDTEPYQKFLSTRKSEIDKLYYIGDRIRDKSAQGNIYIFERTSYHWPETYGGLLWYLWHDYPRGTKARVFIRETSHRFEHPGSRATIKFPDGSVHYAYEVVVNELDLLETTMHEEGKK